MWACTLRALWSIKSVSQRLIQVFSLSSSQSFKSAPAGPDRGLTGPLWMSVNHVWSEIQKVKKLHIWEEKYLSCNCKVNLKRYTGEFNLKYNKYKVCYCPNFKHQDWLNYYYSLKYIFILILVLTKSDLGVMWKIFNSSRRHQIFYK